jgi:two-component system cell cycle response regulator DivK
MNRIAVVEDNPDNRLLLQAMLDGQYDIQEYETGSHAVAGITEHPADLVLLDISLPGMDGVEVLRHLRANPLTAGMPVIALTAHAMAGDRERFLAAGFDGYLTKPIVDESALMSAIESHLVKA